MPPGLDRAKKDPKIMSKINHPKKNFFFYGGWIILGWKKN